MITVSLKQILAKNPCSDGWAKVLHAREKITKEQLESCIEDEHTPISYSKLADDEQFPLSLIIESNSLDDCLWALRCVDDQYYPLMREFAVWCARQVQNLMKDQRSIDALAAARDAAMYAAMDAAGDAAWAAAWAAAMDAAMYAARAAAMAAAMDAAMYAAMDAAGDAAWAAAMDAAMYAARAAAMAAAMDAAMDAAGDAAGDAQAKKLKEILDAGHWVE